MILGRRWEAWLVQFVLCVPMVFLLRWVWPGPPWWLFFLGGVAIAVAIPDDLGRRR